MLRDQGDRMRCPQCGATYEPEVLFCTRDGTPLKLVPRSASAKSLDSDASGSSRRSLSTWSQDAWIKVVSLGVVGALVVLCIALIGMTYSTGSSLELEVVFDNGYGLQVGDNVYVSDYPAGTVAEIWLEGRDVVARLEMEETARPFLRSNSVFYVTNEHLLEQAKCICVFLKNNEPAVALVPGQRIYGIGKIPDILTHVWLEQAKEIAWVLPRLAN